MKYEVGIKMRLRNKMGIKQTNSLNKVLNKQKLKSLKYYVGIKTRLKDKVVVRKITKFKLNLQSKNKNK